MCQSLVERIERSEQLKSVADPELLLLFEDWLEELEQEALDWVKRTGSTNAKELAASLGLSGSGATFLVTKLTRDGVL